MAVRGDIRNVGILQLTSTMARPRWSTPCFRASPCVQRARGGARRHGLQRPGAREGHHHPRKEHGRRVHGPLAEKYGHPEGITKSTSSTRPATPISAARWSAASRWSTASCYSCRRARCHRPVSCCARRRGQAAGHPVVNKVDRPDAHRGGRGRGASICCLAGDRM